MFSESCSWIGIQELSIHRVPRWFWDMYELYTGRDMFVKLTTVYQYLYRKRFYSWIDIESEPVKVNQQLQHRELTCNWITCSWISSWKCCSFSFSVPEITCTQEMWGPIPKPGPLNLHFKQAPWIILMWHLQYNLGVRCPDLNSGCFICLCVIIGNLLNLFIALVSSSRSLNWDVTLLPGPLY